MVIECQDEVVKSALDLVRVRSADRVAQFHSLYIYCIFYITVLIHKLIINMNKKQVNSIVDEKLNRLHDVEQQTLNAHGKWYEFSLTCMFSYNVITIH